MIVRKNDMAPVISENMNIRMDAEAVTVHRNLLHVSDSYYACNLVQT
ncbi:hypothetical protein C8J33_1011811 [Rhizobium sp. PP-CC-3G-465]|nr:hypothetical protein C8J33_1011811 [Rhizobium sp. PP-CC-3G-465]